MDVFIYQLVKVRKCMTHTSEVLLLDKILHGNRSTCLSFCKVSDRTTVNTIIEFIYFFSLGCDGKNVKYRASGRLRSFSSCTGIII